MLLRVLWCEPSCNLSSSRTRFLFLGFILPVIVGTWLSLSFEYLCAREEEESFVGNFAAGSPRLLLCILDHINILGDPLYLEMIALHFIMQSKEVKGVPAGAPCLEMR